MDCNNVPQDTQSAPVTATTDTVSSTIWTVTAGTLPCGCNVAGRAVPGSEINWTTAKCEDHTVEVPYLIECYLRNLEEMVSKYCVHGLSGKEMVDCISEIMVTEGNGNTLKTCEYCKEQFHRYELLVEYHGDYLMCLRCSERASDSDY